jgi:polyphosphate kinase 2 (PPK2 family)
VLVERLEGFANEGEWRRAYAEINHFEEQLVQRGILLLKFWMHISPEEQHRRFQEREKVPFKKYKVTPEDYRNRDRWSSYELAADEMVQRTSTEYARWHLVSANDKRWARIQVLKTVCRELDRALRK